jgi:F-type H+-transporting ATPase subunit gamma
MSRERALRQRLHSLTTLSEAVEAMRSLAAGHFRMARAALLPAREYRAGVERAMAGVPLPRRLTGDGPPGWLVVASDLGLCGAYNSSIARAFLAEPERSGDGRVYCVGRRVGLALRRAGVPVERVYEAAASVAGLTDLVLTLAQDLLELYRAGQITALHAVSARFDGVGKFSPVRTPVLPITVPPATTELHPSPYVSREHLQAIGVRELLFITLYQLLLDALAAEHGARLVSTESARQWLERETATAWRALRAAQREAATQEVLDIAAGTRLQLRHRLESTTPSAPFTAVGREIGQPAPSMERG